MSPTTTTARSASKTPVVVSWGERVRSLGVRSRRLKRGWSRERVMDVLRTMAYVVPLTLLVWVWAQDQQIDFRPQSNVPIRLDHVDASKVVTVVSTPGGDEIGQDGSLRVGSITFQGPRTGLRALAEDASAALLEVRLRRDVGESTVSLRDELNQVEALREAGVTVREVTPAYVVVRIEERAQVEARFVAAGDAEQFASVAFEPPTVTLSGPAGVLRTLEAADGTVLLPVQVPVAEAPLGQQQDVTLSVPVPGGRAGVAPEEVEVRVSFTRREERLESLTLPFPVPVYTQASSALPVVAEGISPVITGVRVRGPAHAIARLRNASQDDPLRAQIRAVLHLERDDEARVGEQVTRQVELILPEGVTLEGAPPTVPFTLRSREGL